MASILVALLVASAASVAHATPAPDDACTAAIQDQIISSDCTTVNGSCSIACYERVNSLLGACVGKYHNSSGEVTMFDPATWVVSASLFAEGDCREAVVDLVLVSSDNYNATCQDAIGAMGSGAVFWCPSGDVNATSCDNSCQTAMDAVYTRCSACEMVTAGSNTFMVKTLALGTSVLVSSPCQADLATCSFGAGCAFDGQPTADANLVCPSGPGDVVGPSDPTCTSTVNAAALQALGGGCQSDIAGVCPDTCVPIFEGVLAACRGKSFTNPQTQEVEAFAPGVQLAAYSSLLPPDCQAGVVNLVVAPDATYEATCADGVLVLLSKAEPWCGNATVGSGTCPEICRNIMNTVASACGPQATVLVGDATVPASAAVLSPTGPKSQLSPQCSADFDTCQFGQGCQFPATKQTTTDAPASTTADSGSGTTVAEVSACREAAAPALAAMGLAAFAGL